MCSTHYSENLKSDFLTSMYTWMWIHQYYSDVYLCIFWACFRLNSAWWYNDMICSEWKLGDEMQFREALVFLQIKVFGVNFFSKIIYNYLLTCTHYYSSHYFSIFSSWCDEKYHIYIYILLTYKFFIWE